MILPDVNLLVYAHRSDSRDHAAARAWLESRLNGSAPVAITSMASTGFVRIVTHRRALTPPSSIGAALDFVATLVAAPAAIRLEPGEAHAGIFDELCRVTGAAGNDVPDAHLAAIAIEVGAELASADQGFGRFPGLRWTNPLG